MADHGEPSDLVEMFNRINTLGRHNTAQVSMSLANHSMMTIRAGGPGTHSWPSQPPYELYEVLISNNPPRFWSKYSDAAESMYDKVPKLLICHHIIRSGGMYGLVYESVNLSRTGLMDLKIALPETSEQGLFAAIRALKGVQLISSTFRFN